MVYMFTGVLILILGIASEYQGKKYTRFFLAFSGGILVALAMMRDISVGIDLKIYVDFYRKIANYPIADLPHIWNQYPEISKEIGFVFICKILSYISTEPSAFIIATSILTVGGHLCIIYLFSKNYYLSIYIYLMFGIYTDSFNVVRSSIAISILGFALYYLTKKKNIQFFLLVLVAMLFHRSALCFLIIWPLSKLRINGKYCLFIIVGCSNLLWFGKKILEIAADQFNYGQYKKFIGNGNGDGLLILCLMVLIGVNLFWKSYKKFDENAEIFVHILVGATFFSICAIHITLASRVAALFLFYICIILPNVVGSLKKSNRIVGTLVIVLFIAFYGTFYIYRLDDIGANVFPYIFRM